MGKHNETGTRGELYAEQYLLSKGYAILHRNWRAAHKEVDLIALDGNQLVFVETKTRSGLGYGFPEEAVSVTKQGQSVAQKLVGKTPIIYSAQSFEGLAIRVRQQINENSKMLCWHGAIPEMNHNELVGWRDKDDSRAVLLLRNEDDYERVQTRMEINKKIIRKYTPNIVELYSKGGSYWEKLFYFIHLTDWVSVYLADLHGVDATEVKVIDHLKGALAGS